MKEEIKIKDSGIWAIVFVLVWALVIIGSGLDDIATAIKSCNL